MVWRGPSQELRIEKNSFLLFFKKHTEGLCVPRAKQGIIPNMYNWDN